MPYILDFPVKADDFVFVSFGQGSSQVVPRENLENQMLFFVNVLAGSSRVHCIYSLHFAHGYLGQFLKGDDFPDVILSEEIFAAIMNGKAKHLHI